MLTSVVCLFFLFPNFASVVQCRELQNHKAVKIALTSFYGVGTHTALRLLARFQIHENAKVSELTDGQVTALTSYLSSPSSVVDPMGKNANNPATLGAAGAGQEGRMRLASPKFVWHGNAGLSPRAMEGVGLGVNQSEMLKRLKKGDDSKLERLEKYMRSLPPTHPRSTNNSKTPRSPEGQKDVLATVLVENEARRKLRENIAHHRNVGSYVGRRHAMGYPVRGQRTNTNARTANKLNRIERRG
ncbi:hypothetical protein FRC01_001776 [Tulasnella sp. 417]|nr:hypothetical protein FRC01_001776 [Tulasnella sp. 417]